MTTDNIKPSQRSHKNNAKYVYRHHKIIKYFIKVIEFSAYLYHSKYLIPQTRKQEGKPQSPTPFTKSCIRHKSRSIST